MPYSRASPAWLWHWWRVACRKCDRRGQYRRSSLIALCGEKAALPDVLRQLAHDCPKRGAIGNDSCGAYFPDLVERPRGGRAAPSSAA